MSDDGKLSTIPKGYTSDSPIKAGGERPEGIKGSPAPFKSWNPGRPVGNSGRIVPPKGECK